MTMYVFLIPTIVMGFLGLLELWFEIMDGETFIKIFFSYLLFIGIAFFVYMLMKNFKEESELKEKNLIR